MYNIDLPSIWLLGIHGGGGGVNSPRLISLAKSSIFCKRIGSRDIPYLSAKTHRIESFSPVPPFIQICRRQVRPRERGGGGRFRCGLPGYDFFVVAKSGYLVSISTLIKV